MKKFPFASAVLTLTLPALAMAGLFDTIDSVGVIQAKDAKPSNRSPAASAEEIENQDLPTETTLPVSAESNAPNPVKAKGLKRGLSKQSEQQSKQQEIQRIQNRD